MDLNRMRDFLMRLQQSYQQAVQAGDMDSAEQYSQLVDQAKQAVQATQGANGPKGPSGPPGQEGIPGQDWATRYNQQNNLKAPPVAQPGQEAPPGGQYYSKPQAPPPDLAREAQQEAGSSWLDTLLPKPQTIMPQPSGQAGLPVGAPAALPQEAALPGDSATKDFMTSPLWGDRDVLFSKKQQGSVWDWLMNPRWFKDDPKSLGAGGAEVLPNAIEAQRITGAKLNGPMSDINEFIGPRLEDVQGPDVSTSAPSGKPDFTQTGDLENFRGGTAEPDWNKLIGKDPGEMDFMDVLGILMGGKNYLNYKQKLQDRYNDKKFNYQMADKRATDINASRNEDREIRKSDLAIELLKNNQRMDDAFEDRLARGENAIVSAVGRSNDPKAAENSETVRQQKAEIQARRNARAQAAQDKQTKKGN